MFKRLKSIKGITLIIALFLIIFVNIQSPWQYFIEGQPLTLEVTAKNSNDDFWQLFYITKEGGQFNEADSLKVDVSKTTSFQTFKFKIYNKDMLFFRLDPGSQPSLIEIKNVTIKRFKNKYIWDAKSISENFTLSRDIQSMKLEDNTLHLNITGNDPTITSGNIISTLSQLKDDKDIYKYSISSIFILLISLVYILILIYKRVKVFLIDIIKSRKLIFELAKTDLKNRYLGSHLGIIWAFVQPMSTILIFWFVFQVGFKSAPIDNYPYVLWLICGMVPWFFFSEAFQGGTNSVLDNSYLVKKIVFRVSSLPIIRILSSLFIHLFFIVVIFVMFFAYGYRPSIYNIQVLYYLFASIALVLGLSWITSSLVVFLRDLGQIISILIQFWFYLTPIFWSFKIMPEKYQFLFKLNPVYYLVEGYRDTFINHIWFWQHYNLTINYWLVTLTLFFTGVLLFRRLRPHFADVL